MIAGKVRLRLTSASLEARSRVNSAASTGCAEQIVSRGRATQLHETIFGRRPDWPTSAPSSSARSRWPAGSGRGNGRSRPRLGEFRTEAAFTEAARAAFATFLSGCSFPAVWRYPVVAARVSPGWHPCAVPGPGSPAAERPRSGMDAAASRPFGQTVERSFYCRSCQLTARGRWVPAGWYVLERAAGGGARHLRVGLYCSLDCLAAAGSDLAAAEQDAGARRGLPPGAARDPARLTEVAQTLLHQGATIRAAGDELGVPTSALRHWLRAAGVQVGADGTLIGSASTAPPSARPDEHSDKSHPCSGRAPEAA